MNPFKNWTRRDGLWAGVIGFYLTNMTLTRLILSARQTCVTISSQVEAVARTYEANPVVFDVLKQSNFIGFLISYFLLPAVLIACYIMLRWYFTGRGKEQEHILDFFVITLFFSVLMNFANDFGVWLGVLM